MKIRDLKIRRKRVVERLAGGIAARLAALEVLDELGRSLRKAPWIGPVKEPGAFGSKGLGRKQHQDADDRQESPGSSSSRHL